MPMRVPALFLLLLSLPMVAQVDMKTSQNPFFSPADSQKLSFHFENKSFLKNNEYFNVLNEGYTLIGFQAKPALVYHPGATTRLEAGASLLKYAGRDGIYKAEPLFRFQYQPAPCFQMILGSIYGGANHGLVEPIYQWERDLTHPVENGLQFLLNSNQIKADIWLEWEKFIEPGDPFQEELSVGSSIAWKLSPGEHDFTIYLPFQSLISHHGGQDLSVDLPLQTIANYATGIRTSWLTGSNQLKQINFDFWYMGYNDLSPQKLQKYSHGFALYPKTEIKYTNFILQAGFYHGEKFMAIDGEPIFHSATIPYNGNFFTDQNLITLKLIYQKQIERGISIGTYYETYINAKSGHNDYTYGVHLLLNRTFFIAQIK
jgi:hypothetical protein